MKATAVAPSNIAFIKYWGKKDEKLRLPENGSISMNLSNLLTRTTVEFHKKYNEDVVIINGKQEEKESSRVIKHLDRVRETAGIKEHAKVVSENNFPSKTGLSSSASGLAALSLAASSAAGLELPEKELSILARMGSGSACRSIPDGFTEWLDGDTSETSYAVSLFKPDYWDIADVVAVVSKDKKEVSSTEGQKSANSSPFYKNRLERMKEKIRLIKGFLNKKDFTKFGELVEAEALELHSIMLTSRPSLIYLLPASLKLMHLVKRWREEGLEVYFTVNTGQDVHLICQKGSVEKLKSRLRKVEEVRDVIINCPANGARIVDGHLF
jgi:diphosphomevalonate decarboxylase